MPWSEDTCPNCQERVGYSLLDGLCNYCFGELIITPLHQAEHDAAQATMEAYGRRYKIEVALGLRSMPSDEPILDRNTAPVRHRVTGSFKRIITESTDVEDVFNE